MNFISHHLIEFEGHCDICCFVYNLNYPFSPNESSPDHPDDECPFHEDEERRIHRVSECAVHSREPSPHPGSADPELLGPRSRFARVGKKTISIFIARVDR